MRGRPQLACLLVAISGLLAGFSPGRSSILVFSDEQKWPPDTNKSNWPADESLRIQISAADGNDAPRCVVEVNGELWIGGTLGLYRWRPGDQRLQRIWGDGHTPLNVRCLHHAGGTVLAGTPTGLHAINVTKPALRGEPLIAKYILSLTENADSLWIGTTSTAYVWPHWTDLDTTHLVDLELGAAVYSLARGPDGRVWAATGSGIVYFAPNRERVPQRPDYNPHGGFDSDGNFSTRRTGFSIKTATNAFGLVYPYKDSLWIQTNLSSRDAVRLEGLTKGAGAEWKRVNEVSWLSACLEANGFLWVGANQPSAEKRAGLFRWPGRQTGQPLQVISARVNGLSRSGDTLWVAAAEGIYRVNGLSRPAWKPKVVVTETTPTTRERPVFTDGEVVVRWKTAGGLAGRTTREKIRYEVALLSADGQPQATETGKRDADTGTWEVTIRLNGLPQGDYGYRISAYDLNENKAIAEFISEDGSPRESVQPFVVRDRALYLFWRFGVPLLLLGSIVGLSITLLLSGPLRRTWLVKVRGRRYSLTIGDSVPCSFEIEEIAPRSERPEGTEGQVYRVRQWFASPFTRQCDVEVPPQWTAEERPEELLGAASDELLRVVADLGTALQEAVRTLSTTATPGDQLRLITIPIERQFARLEHAVRTATDATYARRMGNQYAAYATALQFGERGHLVDTLRQWLRNPTFLAAWIAGLRAHIGTRSTVVYAGEHVFRYPWSLVIGSRWSLGMSATVAGQMMTTTSPIPETTQEWLRFTALGCQGGNNNDNLPGVANEIRRVRETFRRTGARVLSPRGERSATAARVEDLKRALEQSDIVHVAAHASPDAIQLSDGNFGVVNIEEIGRIRTRLLVLSACRAAALDQVGLSLARRFVSQGVNVIASVEWVRDDFCARFFPALYQNMLPPLLGPTNTSGVGVDLGTAIRRAAASSTEGGQERDARLPAHKRIAGSRSSVDTFILFGDPRLTIRLVAPDAD